MMKKALYLVLVAVLVLSCAPVDDADDIDNLVPALTISKGEAEKIEENILKKQWHFYWDKVKRCLR